GATLMRELSAVGFCDRTVTRASHTVTTGGSVAVHRTAAHEDRGPRDQLTAQPAPATPLVVSAGGPLRLHQVDQNQPGRDDLPDPVTEGPVVLGVGGPPLPVLLHIGPTVEVRIAHRHPGLSRHV